MSSITINLRPGHEPKVQPYNTDNNLEVGRVNSSTMWGNRELN